MAKIGFDKFIKILAKIPFWQGIIFFFIKLLLFFSYSPNILIIVHSISALYELNKHLHPFVNTVNVFSFNSSSDKNELMIISASQVSKKHILSLFSLNDKKQFLIGLFKKDSSIESNLNLIEIT